MCRKMRSFAKKANERKRKYCTRYSDRLTFPILARNGSGGGRVIKT